MIKVTNSEIGFEHVVKPTMFPDGSSQVWKIPEPILHAWEVRIDWFFENEAEFFHVKQLTDLLHRQSEPNIDLYIPFLPYGRQDKQIDNNCTFARSSFIDLLWTLNVNRTITVDIHSGNTDIVRNINVDQVHTKLIHQLKPTYLVAPDAGAAKRYLAFNDYPTIVFEKKRNQLTGEIEGHTADLSKVKSGDSFLILDDICDGGATFCSISKALHEAQQNIGVHLFVTHGLFSKGRHVLHQAGINEIFTTNTLLKNHGLENVYEVV